MICQSNNVLFVVWLQHFQLWCFKVDTWFGMPYSEECWKYLVDAKMVEGFVWIVAELAGWYPKGPDVHRPLGVEG